MSAFTRFFSSFFLFAAFLLLLLVSLSTPIIKTIWLMSATADISASFLGFQAGSAFEDVRFGIWGWCADEASYTVLGDTHELVAAQCSAPHLGYTLDPTVSEILQITNQSNHADLILTSITTALVLHPIACGLVFLALLLSFHHAATPNPNRFSLFVTVPISVLACVITTIIFIVDVVAVAITRSKVSSATDGAVTIAFGNAVWMVLGAMIAVWIGQGLVCGGVCCGERGYFHGRRPFGRAWQDRAGKY